MSDPFSPHNEPQSAAEYVAEAALEVAKDAARDVKREIEHVYVLVRLERTGEDIDSTTAAYGRGREPSARDFMAHLLAHARAVAANNGIALDITIDGTALPRRDPDR